MKSQDSYSNISFLDAKFLLESDSSVIIEERNSLSRHSDQITKTLIDHQIESSSKLQLLAESHREPSCCEVIGMLIKSALPSLIQGLAANIAFTTMIYFISLKENVLLIGAVGMGSTLYFTGIIAFLQALNLGMASLGSQAYGSKNPELLGVYFKRALILQIIVYIPLAALVSQIALLFKLIGFAADLSDDIQKVLIAMMPAAIPFVYFDAGKNFLVSQKIFAPQGYIQLITSVLDVATQYFLLIYLDWDIYGIGIARFSMESCRAIILYCYIQYSGRCRDSLVSWNRTCFQELWTQFKFQIVAGGLQIIDLVGTQIILLQTAYFSDDEVAANVVVTRITKFCLIWTLSIGVALSSFVGNAMGEANPKKARRFIKMGILLDCVLICCMWLLLGTQSAYMSLIFSDNEHVQKYTEGLLLFFMTITPFDNLQNVLGGVLRSIGKEKQSTKLYLFTYYPLAIPLSIIFAHYLKWRVYGLYAAMLIAKGLNTVGSIYFLCTASLSEQIEFVVQRVQENKEKISPGLLDKSESALRSRMKPETQCKTEDDPQKLSTKDSSIIGKRRAFTNSTRSDEEP